MPDSFCIDVIDKFKIALNQIEDGYIRTGAHSQSSKSFQRRNRSGSVDGSTGNDLLQSQPQHEELREHIRKIKHLIGKAGAIKIRRDRVRKEILFKGALCHFPCEVS